MPIAIVCPVCRRADAVQWKASSVSGALVPDDLAITDRRYGVTLELFECSCGYRFADPERLPDLLALYGALDDPAYEEGADERVLQQQALLRRALAVATDARTLLDVGAASGLMVEAATAAGLQAIGVEPSSTLAAAARSRGLDVRTGTLEEVELDDLRFDVVMVVDVIEHVSDPLALLSACRDRVADGGVLVVVTPDAAALVARLLGRRWWHLRLAHVGYHDRRTLAHALIATGFVPVQWWRPGWVFDVGYLLERVSSYLPFLAPVVRRVDATSLARRRVPLNLFDSIAVIARPRGGARS